MIYPLNFSFSLSLLFMGFLLSNIFGILGSSKSIVFLFILCIEFINCFVYTQKTKRVYVVRSLSPFPFPKGKGVANQGKGDRTVTDRFFLSNLKKSFISIFLRFSYKVDSKEQQIKDQRPFFKYTSLIPFVLNFFKIGFEFGFFVDAFKLGS